MFVRWTIGLQLLLSLCSLVAEPIHSHKSPSRRESLRSFVTDKQAKDLFRWLKSTHFKKVSYDGGCFHRAELSAYEIETKKSIKAHSVIIFCGQPVKMRPQEAWNTKGKQDWNKRGRYFWNTHFATVVRGKTQEGKLKHWVLDPLFDEPLLLSDWLIRINPEVKNPSTDVYQVTRKRLNQGAPRNKCIYALDKAINLHQSNVPGSWDDQIIQRTRQSLLDGLDPRK